MPLVRLLQTVQRAASRRALSGLALTAVALWLLCAVPGSSAAAGGDAWSGRPATDFVLDTLDGRRLRLSELRGRVVLLNFWASWCTACSVEMPWLVQFDARYRSRGLTVLGVAVDASDRDEIARFARQHGASYPVLFADGHVEQSYGGVRFLPQTFYIGRDGRIIRQVYGIRSQSEFEADIRRALGLPGA